MDLTAIASLPAVKSTMLCDPAGALLQATGEDDAESAAAVVGFLTATLGRVGDELGLGPLYRMSVAGPARATLIVSLGDSVLSTVIAPSSAFPTVENAIDTILQG